MFAVKQGPPIQFRSAEIENLVDIRSQNRNYAASRDLARYYELLKRELTSLRLPQEMEYLIADACNGRDFTFDTSEFIWAVVIKEMKTRSLDKKWNVNGDLLIQKIDHLTPGQAMALVDWSESIHRNPDVSEDIKEKIFSTGSSDGLISPADLRPEIRAFFESGGQKLGDPDAPRPTWDQLAEAESRLDLLMKRVSTPLSSGGWDAALRQIWGGPDGVRSQIEKLVGYFAEGDNPILHGSAPYEVAIQALYNRFNDVQPPEDEEIE